MSRCPDLYNRRCTGKINSTDSVGHGGGCVYRVNNFCFCFVSCFVFAHLVVAFFFFCLPPFSLPTRLPKSQGHKAETLIPPPLSATVRLTSGSWKDAVHSSCDSPNTSRRFTLGASNAYVPGWRKPDVLRPGIVGMRGAMVIRLRPCAN